MTRTTLVFVLAALTTAAFAAPGTINPVVIFLIKFS